MKRKKTLSDNRRNNNKGHETLSLTGHSKRNRNEGGLLIKIDP
jgi:hypothetical protein